MRDLLLLLLTVVRVTEAAAAVAQKWEMYIWKNWKQNVVKQNVVVIDACVYVLDFIGRVENVVVSNEYQKSTRVPRHILGY